MRCSCRAEKDFYVIVKVLTSMSMETLGFLPMKETDAYCIFGMSSPETNRLGVCKSTQRSEVILPEMVLFIPKELHQSRQYIDGVC